MTTRHATSSAGRDLACVLLIVAAFWGLAMHWELSEKLAHWLQTYEHFQLDEMPLTLLVLSLGLAWFAFQRNREIAKLLHANRHLTQRLFTAQEDERRILARELHDEVGQVCTALRIEAAYIGKAIPHNPSAALDAAQRIDQSSLRMHQLTRDMLQRLRPADLDSLGFEEALKALCRLWGEQCQIECTILVGALPNSLDDAWCTALYRVTQEALTNIAKHAQATRVEVRLHAQSERLILSITDNGQGVQAGASHAQGLGLTGMRERVASLQGQLDFDDAKPGLRIHVQIPLAKASP